MSNKHVMPIVVLLGFSMGMATAAPLSGGHASAGKQKAATCAGCHGADGNSPNAQFPRLAGQNAGYIARQLKLFKSGKRSSPIMGTMAELLSQQDVKDVAAYFAAQELVPDGVAHSKLAGAGGHIFDQGKVSAGVPACASCHGVAGMGNAAAGFPRIAGQHAVYIEKQLRAFRDGSRAGDPQASIMHGIAKGLTDDDIKAVAVYAAGMQSQGAD